MLFFSDERSAKIPRGCGTIVHRISSPQFVDPTSLCICPCTNRILVADNGAGCVFACQPALSLLGGNRILAGDTGGNGSTCNSTVVSALIGAGSLSPGNQKLAGLTSFGRSATLQPGSNRTISRASLGSVGSTGKTANATSGDRSGTVGGSQLTASEVCQRVTGLCATPKGDIVLAAGSLVHVS
ncbi:unnamed protein product [Protopolystoma xenopodis]|uniref:Uncharacterized protein n=1 Tax=Protopolystoma xenopodis TaxID=117903 RepID=A0A3S5FBV5_9PLAT|nr:unnamed protein product [Protopolystoma xenopodis]